MIYIGWIGSFMLAICGAPQAWMSFKNKSSVGISWGFLVLWTLGELLTLIYVLPTFQWPLLFNYVVNLLFLNIIIYYKIKGKL